MNTNTIIRQAKTLLDVQKVMDTHLEDNTGWEYAGHTLTWNSKIEFYILILVLKREKPSLKSDVGTPHDFYPHHRVTGKTTT